MILRLLTIDGTTANGVLTYGGTNNIDTEANLTFDGSSLNVNGQLYGGFGSKTTGGTADWNHSTNARSGNGYTLLLNSATNGPTTASNATNNSYYHTLNFEYASYDNDGNMTQLGIPYSFSTSLYGVRPVIRSRYGGTWSSWNSLITGNSAGQVLGAFGSAAAPSYTFATDVTVDGDTGMYRAGANALGFSTGGTERMRINSSGLIKVGPNGGDTTNVFEIDTSGSTQHGLMINADQARAAGRYALLVDDEDPNSRGSVVIQTASGPSLTTTGSVGIGTVSPNRLLHLQSTGDAIMQITSADGSGAYIDLGDVSDVDGGRIVYDSGSNLLFNTASTEKVRITSAGNVGIGTASPGAKFTVLKDGTQASSVSTTYQIQTVSNSNGGIAIQAGASSTAYLVFGDNGDYDAGRIAYQNSNHKMLFFTNNASKMALDTSGKLGIGTNGPDTLLHIVNTGSGGTTTLKLEDNAREMYLGRDTIKVTTLDGSTAAQLYIGSNTTFSGTVTTGAGITLGGTITMASGAGQFIHNNTASRDKLRVWNSSFYTIGMDNSMSFGGLNDYAMTFQFNEDADRGFVWLHQNHSDAQGAMALTTGGKLTVADSIRVGYGESDTTTPGATYALDVSGSIGATADVVAYVSSDKRLKDNIKNIANPLEKLEKLNGVEFDWNDKQDLYKGHDIGVIAQEVEEVLPEIVETREDGHKAVKYDRMVALLIEAVKEQQQQIDELRKGNFVIETGD